jgi:hypothetical protein
VLAGLVLARASAGLADGTIRNDTEHSDLIREWLGRPLWEMQPEDVDAYFGRVLRGARPSTRTGGPAPRREPRPPRTGRRLGALPAVHQPEWLDHRVSDRFSSREERDRCCAALFPGGQLERIGGAVVRLTWNSAV